MDDFIIFDTDTSIKLQEYLKSIGLNLRFKTYESTFFNNDLYILGNVYTTNPDHIINKKTIQV